MKNYTGIRNKMLVVLDKKSFKKKDNKGRNITYITCMCDCGVIKEIRACNLKSTASCGCKQSIAGKIYGRLTVLDEFRIIRVDEIRTYREWNCRCECGNEKFVSTANLNSGHVKSCGCISVLPDRLAAKRRILSSYKKRAKKRKLEFNIDFDSFIILIEGECFYCGIVGSNSKKDYHGEYMYNGIDRVDNSVGYISENIVTSCKDCNYAKRDMSIEKFKNLIGRIYHRLVV